VEIEKIPDAGYRCVRVDVFISKENVAGDKKQEAGVLLII
jgi:hypothetical protein